MDTVNQDTWELADQEDTSEERMLRQIEHMQGKITNQRRALAGLNKAYYASRQNEEAFGRFMDATTFEEFRSILKRVAVRKLSETENEDTCDDCRPATFGGDECTCDECRPDLECTCDDCDVRQSGPCCSPSLFPFGR